jgi:agmatine deiminase
MSKSIDVSAREAGYRMPAEFEPVAAVWLTYPHNPETWPGCLDQAREQYDFFMSQVARFADVQMTGKRHGWKTNDSWIRDYGPVFVVNNAGELACHDFVFNGWGGKYGDEYPDDDVIPVKVAELLGIPIWRHDMVLEGGSIDVNGRGTVMTTEQCLLNKNRNPRKSRDEIEQALHDALGTSHVIWLPGGIEGDDTDGHIDDVARFVGPTTVAAIRAPEGHADHQTLERNWAALQSARDQDGQTLELIELPVPEPVVYDYPADRFGPGGRNLCPASYANFLILTEAVLVPTFGCAADDVALRAIERALPGRSVIGIRAEWLVVGLGAMHCLSCQQPALPHA